MSVTQRAFASQLAVAAFSVSAAVLAEALASASHARSRGPAAAMLEAVWTLGLWALPSVLVALTLAWALAVACREASLVEVLRAAWALPARRDALLIGMVCGAALLGWVFLMARAGAAFHNLELAAALTAVATLCGLLLLALAGMQGLRTLRRRRQAGQHLRALPALAVAAVLLMLLSIALSCRSGLLQLEPRLLLAPLVFVVTLVVSDGSQQMRSRTGRATLLPAVVAAVTWLLLLFGGTRVESALAQQAGWSKILIAAVQRLSDFDRDGYSGFLGGGDCAPFDAAVNPSAVEIVGDGLDNNCVAGDGGRATEPRRPSWGPSAHGSPAKLNVVVVTIETLRRDHASFVHAAHDTTPTLRALAPESWVFERMYSAAPLTRLALASLFSSFAPSEIDWLAQAPEKRMRRVGPETPWLPELLRARGYETIAVLTDFSAFTAQENAGFERGFQHYDISTKLEYRGGTMWGFPAAEQIDKALGYAAHAARPFLLWLHLFEPHYRYEQPPDAPVFGSDEQSRYDAEIWHADHQLDRLIDGLRKLGAWDETLLFVSGDHGEAFGEHGDRWHGSNLHDPQLRPAALLRIPGMTGKRVQQAVTFTDIAPTLARVLGDRLSFDQLRGRSLAPLMHHASLPSGEPGFVAESFSVDDGHAYQAALIAHPLKLIYVEAGRRFTLFDLAADPEERTPLDPSAEPRAAPLMRELQGYLERTRR